MPTIRVIAAVVVQDDEYLLAKRPYNKRHGGLWEFPGGKIDDGESDLVAVNRELKEELNIAATRIGRKFWQSQDPGSDFLIEFHEVIIDGTPEALEHEDLKWIPIHDFHGFQLAPTDARFVNDYLLGGKP
mgnify:CR=1 FL=1